MDHHPIPDATAPRAFEAPPSGARKRLPPLVTSLVAAIALTLLMAGCGSDDDTPDAVVKSSAPASEASTTETTTSDTPGTTDDDSDSDGGMTAADDDDDTTTSDADDTSSESATIDGQTDTITGELDGTNPVAHVIVVPEGVTATVTVTPVDDIDIVVTGEQEEIDSELSGAPEVLEGVGPIDETIEISSFFDEPGGYTITIES